MGCTKGLSKGASRTMNTSTDTHTLLKQFTANISINGVFTFVAIVALLSAVHTLYLYQYRRLFETEPTSNSELIKDTKSEDDEESQVPSVPQSTNRIPSLMGKLVAALGAGFYIAFCMHSMLVTASEFEGPGLISLDGHFRNAMAGCAFSIFFRLPFRNKIGLSKKYQADSLILIIIPYIVDFYAPATYFQERAVIDRMILPALGALCFVGSTL